MTMRPCRRFGTYHWQHSRLEQHTCFQFLLFLLLHLPQDLLLHLLQDEGKAKVEDEGEEVLLRLQLQLLPLQLHLLRLLHLLHLLHLLLHEGEDEAEEEDEVEEEAKGRPFLYSRNLTALACATQGHKILV